MALPLALNVAGVPLLVSPVISTDVRSSLASAICDATARFQIRSYTRISSLSRMRLERRRRAAEVGRANRFVRFLRVADLGLVLARALVEVGAVQLDHRVLALRPAPCC